MKFEILQIDTQETLSVCCHPKILLPWKRDVTTSPLYLGELRQVTRRGRRSLARRFPRKQDCIPKFSHDKKKRINSLTCVWPGRDK